MYKRCKLFYQVEFPDGVPRLLRCSEETDTWTMELDIAITVQKGRAASGTGDSTSVRVTTAGPECSIRRLPGRSPRVSLQATGRLRKGCRGAV
jgi:hypothetical protein